MPTAVEKRDQVIVEILRYPQTDEDLRAIARFLVFGSNAADVPTKLVRAQRDALEELDGW